MELILALALWLIFGHASGNSIGSDFDSLNQCSKYHFEEKVLEKLVKLEHKVEIFTERIKTWEIKIQSDLETIDETKKKLYETTSTVTQRDATTGGGGEDRERYFNKSYQELMSEFKSTLKIKSDELENTMKTRVVEFEAQIKAVYSEVKMLLNSTTAESTTRDQLTGMDKISTINATVQQILSNYEERDKNITNAITILKETLENELQEITEAGVVLENRIESAVSDVELELNRTIQETRSTQSMGEPVAVTACAESNWFTRVRPIPFRTLLTSYGISDYTTRTLQNEAVFNCSHPGIYFVGLSVVRTSECYDVYKNSQPVIDGGSGSWMSVVSLKKDDMLYVRPKKNLYYFRKICLTIFKLFDANSVE